MRSVNKLITIICICNLLILRVWSVGEDYTKLYEYDRALSLNSEVSLIKETDMYRVYKVYYDSVNAVRVPALLIIPVRDSPPYPCIVFLHGYGGRKEDALALASFASRAGYAVFSIDAVYHGEREVPGKALYSPDFEDSIRGIRQTIIDLRRGVDFLEIRSEIDNSRIGYVGGSMGGILGAIFIGVEDRIKAAILIVPGGNMSLMIRESEHPAIPPIRKRIEELGLTYGDVQRMMNPVEPLNFIGRFSPKPVQFHIGRFDKIVPAEAGRQLADKAGEPKQVYWYDAGHSLPLDLVAIRALSFLNENLKGSVSHTTQLSLLLIAGIMELRELLKTFAPLLLAVSLIAILLIILHLKRRWM